MYKEIFSERLKKLRKKYNLTQAQLANMADCSQQVINIYENQKQFPRLENIILLAKALNTSVDYLCGITENESSLEKDLIFKDNYSSQEICRALIILMESKLFTFNKNTIEINDLDISSFISDVLDIKKIENTIEESNLSKDVFDTKQAIVEKIHNTKITTETEIDFIIVK